MYTLIKDTFPLFYYSLIGKSQVCTEKTIFISARLQYASNPAEAKVCDLRNESLNAYKSNIILTVCYVFLGKPHISHIAKSAALRKVQ